MILKMSHRTSRTSNRIGIRASTLNEALELIENDFLMLLLNCKSKVVEC